MESDYGQLRDKILLPVKQELDELEEEFGPRRGLIQERLAVLEEVTRRAVIERHETVKAAGMSAVYVRGKVSWNHDLLQGMAVHMPEILNAQNLGEPSVQLRTDKR